MHNDNGCDTGDDMKEEHSAFSLMLPVVEWMLSSVRILPEESAVEVFIGFGACTR